MEGKRGSALQKMIQTPIIILLFICTLGFSSAIVMETELGEELETYIVHLSTPSEEVSTSPDALESWYSSFLPKSTQSLGQKSRLVHKYRNVVTGFAARLTPGEVKEMEKKEGFLSARPQKKFSLHTTHSPAFLGLQQNLGIWNGSNYGEGVIIGLLDTGITPGHPSFDDEDMLPPPSKWKGKCEFGACNKKLIGARNYVDTTKPPFDDEGHGTHTSSTAGGKFVKDANVFGQAKGTAVGIAPRAHIAMYKVCEEFCDESAILAAMDAAIEDGVDVLSLSLGGGSSPFYSDSIATGAFSAIQKGIFVSCSAGNDGPENFTLSNEAPWILTVGASTIDRKIRATAVLGNKEEFDGETLFQPADFPPTLLPLVFPGLIDEYAAVCGEGSLNNTDVRGKVVVCVKGGGVARIDKGKEVKANGGAAMILINPETDGYSTLADAHVLPAAHVSYAAGQKIIAYLNSTSSPMATIAFKGTIIGDKDAPTVTSFSSRGPSLESPGILKPDIIGPGVSILAAWPISVENDTNTESTFNIISGTSMSCPHLSGVAALLKSAHPDWSPAAIKSAIMTTADTMNLNYEPILDQRLLPADIFTVGAGHVNPSKANDPGLVYDLQPEDYIPYLCGLNYTDREVAQIVQEKVNCSAVSIIPEAQLNYPSFAVKLESGASKSYTRTVTNVGDAESIYTLGMTGLPGVVVSVNPTRLEFTKIKQQLTYQVTFSRSPNAPSSSFVYGAITWSSNNRVVRSAVSVALE